MGENENNKGGIPEELKDSRFVFGIFDNSDDGCSAVAWSGEEKDLVQIALGMASFVQNHKAVLVAMMTALAPDKDGVSDIDRISVRSTDMDRIISGDGRKG